MRTHDENADREDLKQILQVMDARQREKRQKERAVEAEENRLEKESAEARKALLSERADEKEALGAEVLEKVKLLGDDKLIRRFRRVEGYGWGGFIPIHKRVVANPAELRRDMPTSRRVTEMFQLSGRGVLVYNQSYTALHFAEGMMQAEVCRNPLRYGVKLEKPADFLKLNITSIESFLKALNDGQPYRSATKRISEQVKEGVE